MPELNPTSDAGDLATGPSAGDPDTIRGIANIASYAGLTFKQCQLALERGWLPGTQLGADGMWIARKHEIDAAVAARRQYHAASLLTCVETWMNFALTDHSHRDMILAELQAGGELRLLATALRAELHLIDRTGVDTGAVTVCDRPPRLPLQPAVIN